MGGPQLRAILTLTLVALLATTPALAGSTTTTDPIGDQYLVDREESLPFFGQPVRCGDAATDLKSMVVASDANTVSVAITVRDLGSTHVGCTLVPSASADSQLVEWRLNGEAPLVCEEIGETTVTTCDQPPVEYEFQGVYERGFNGESSCIIIGFLDRARSECIGTLRIDGSTLVWTAPIQGTVIASNGDTRSFDFRGQVVTPQADSITWFNGAATLLDDAVATGNMTL